MPYYDLQPQKKSYTWLFIVLGILVVIGFLAAVARLFPPDTPEQAAAKLAAQFDATIAQDKVDGPLMMQLKADFPDDYDRLRAQSIAAYQAGQRGQQISNVNIAYMRSFMLEHTEDMASAPPENMKAMRDAELALVINLKDTSVDQCAAFSRGGLQPDGPYGPVTLQDMANLTSARLHAAVAGRQHRVVHTKMTNADQINLYRAMQKHGLTPDLASAIADPKKLAVASPEQHCAVGLLVERTISDMPAPLADRWTAETVRTTFAPKS